MFEGLEPEYKDNNHCLLSGDRPTPWYIHVLYELMQEGKVSVGEYAHVKSLDAYHRK